MKSFMRNNNKNKKKGFTLIETLVAISMLAISIAAVMSAIQLSVRSTAFSKSEVTAKFLAEEGVESIRNLRDKNIINLGQSAWLTNIANAGGPCGDVTTGAVKKCDIDVVAQTNPTNCPSGTCSPLLYNAATNIYNKTTGTASPFTRSISVTRVDGGASPYSVLVHVVVSWPSQIGTLTATADDYIYAWYLP